jgi:hypothetical protein
MSRLKMTQIGSPTARSKYMDAEVCAIMWLSRIRMPFNFQAKYFPY